MTEILKKIIVVDDNPENLNAIKNALKGVYDVYPSITAAHMFELLEHFIPDLILLDVAMQGVNGYEAAKTLKSDSKHKDIPVIFITSLNDPESEMEGLNLGAIDYIHKPVVIPLLLRRIQTHLAVLEQQKLILEHSQKIEELLEIKTKEVSLREKAEIEALNASRAKGEFLSHMSHEIRSPLNAVIGMINMASESDDLQTIKNYLKKAHDSGKHVLCLINDILDMSKIEANKLELSYGEFSFVKMLTAIINEAGVRAGEKSIELSVNVNKNVPPLIISDELRLSQVITNLMTNAIKFTPEKGRISLTTQNVEEKDGEITIRIEVTDTGIGISPEQQKKLFTSYSQADSSIAKNFGGTGLGLLISKRIVELMRGSIWVESELGKGAKFIFTIKVKKGTEKADDKPSSQEKLSKTVFDFSKYTILVAEDDEINREIMSTLFKKAGITYDIAEHGKRAVELFHKQPEKYNMILMDVHMPEMDGYEATQAIRASELEIAKKIRIIALTADVFKEDIEKCLAAGMDGHIGKPFLPKDLYENLQKHLEMGHRN
jgi:signal transduction histidine kinase